MAINKILFLWLLLLVALTAAHAKDVPQGETGGIEIRQPPHDKIAEYDNQRAFDYQVTARNPETILERFKYWLNRQIARLFANPTAQNILGIIVYLGFGALIILLLNQFLVGNISGLFIGKKSGNSQVFSVQQEPDSQRDLGKLIEKAINNRQFQLATRYLYQDSLRRLRNGGYISWERDKTNRDYLYEIKKNDLRNIFREVTRYYEYAEYGNLTLSSKRFSKVYDRFKEMRTLIQSPS